MQPRWRRPQLALLALVLAVVIGYVINAARNSDDHPNRPAATTSASSSTTSTIPTAASTGPTRSTGSTRSTSTAGAVMLSSLPPQAAQTVHLIQAGGPFPYSQDGVVFDNNEHLLPSHPRGYYHEYTVVTPAASDRATRRIVTGQAGEYYYTGDHYETFHRVDITR
jgi:ribonuclease T1